MFGFKLCYRKEKANMKKLLALGLSVLMLAGIGSAAGCTNDSRNSSGESVIYKDVIPSPACPQIDESGYAVLYFDAESEIGIASCRERV